MSTKIEEAAAALRDAVDALARRPGQMTVHQWAEDRTYLNAMEATDTLLAAINEALASAEQRAREAREAGYREGWDDHDAGMRGDYTVAIEAAAERRGAVRALREAASEADEAMVDGMMVFNEDGRSRMGDVEQWLRELADAIESEAAAMGGTEGGGT